MIPVNSPLISDESKQSFESRGKILLTGEYAILDGAKGIAIPTKFKQTLVCHELNNTSILFVLLIGSFSSDIPSKIMVDF